MADYCSVGGDEDQVDKRLWMIQMWDSDRNVIEVDDIGKVDQHCACKEKGFRTFDMRNSNQNLIEVDDIYRV